MHLLHPHTSSICSSVSLPAPDLCACDTYMYAQSLPHVLREEWACALCSSHYVFFENNEDVQCRPSAILCSLINYYACSMPERWVKTLNTSIQNYNIPNNTQSTLRCTMYYQRPTWIYAEYTLSLSPLWILQDKITCRIQWIAHAQGGNYTTVHTVFPRNLASPRIITALEISPHISGDGSQ